jgi:hypothetical protein
MKPEENRATADASRRNRTKVHGLTICTTTTTIAISVFFSTTYGVFIVAISS